MIDHLNLPVSDLKRSTAFYEVVLLQLGMQILMQNDDVVGFGQETWEFGIVEESKTHIPMHVAFIADTHEQVELFYSTALEAGALDNGAPGQRAEFGPSYYAAFVFDPDGNNIEAVCRREC